MSFWKFIKTWFVRAFQKSVHGSHGVHQFVVVLFGFFVFLGLVGIIRSPFVEEPKMLIAAPFIAAVVIFLVSLVFYAYRLYTALSEKF
jgi:hypothetical protein